MTDPSKHRLQQSISVEPDPSRRSLGFALLGAIGGASLLAACGPGPTDDSEPYDPEPGSTPGNHQYPLTGANAVAWFDTYSELRDLTGGATVTNVNVALGRDPGFGGIFVWSADLTTMDNGGTVIVPTSTPRTGCWKRVYEGALNAKWFGARGNGSTPDTAAIQAAIDAAAGLSAPAPVLIPAGKYLVTNLGVHSNTVLIGAGPGLTSLQQQNGSMGALLARHSSVPWSVENCTIRDLELRGFDGNGGTGLELVSFTGGMFENLRIGLFRSGSGSGIGISLTNSYRPKVNSNDPSKTTDMGGCFRNTFVGITIGDSNTGLLVDSAAVTQTACGYNRFFSLTVYQEDDCIVLRNTNGNGSIYNVFNGVLLQGTADGNRGVYCEGSANTFVNLVVDGIPGENIELAASASGNVFFSPSVNRERVVNNSVRGAANTFFGGACFSGGLGQPFSLQEIREGGAGTTLVLQATGEANGPEVRLATDADPLQWRFGVSSGRANAYFSLVQGRNLVERWNTDLSSYKTGDLGFTNPLKGVLLKDRNNGNTYRLHVTNGVLGVELV